MSILRLSACSTTSREIKTMRKSFVWLLERSKDGMVLSLERCRTACGLLQIYDPCGLIISDLMSFIEDRCVNSML